MRTPRFRLSVSLISRVRRQSARPWFSRFVLLSMLIGGALNCSGDTIASPPLETANVYWALRFDYHTANLALTAPYDTVHLHAVLSNAHGDPLPNLGPVTYTAEDPAVTVDSTGLVTAHAVTGTTRVIATLQDPQQQVTHADTVLIQVTPTPPPLPLTFSLQPAPGDSAKRAVLQDQKSSLWPARVTDAAGDTVCSVAACVLLIEYASSNDFVATRLNTGTGPELGLFGDTGHVVITATTFAYGKVLRDTVVFWVALPIIYTVKLAALPTDTLRHVIVRFAMPKVIVLGVGGVLEFNTAFTRNTVNFDVLFDHPEVADTASCFLPVYDAFGIPKPQVTSADTGNIAPFGGDSTHFVTPAGFTLPPNFNAATNCRARRFSVPGVYHWHSSVITPADTFTLIIKKE